MLYQNNQQCRVIVKVKETSDWNTSGNNNVRKEPSVSNRQ